MSETTLCCMAVWLSCTLHTSLALENTGLRRCGIHLGQLTVWAPQIVVSEWPRIQRTVKFEPVEPYFPGLFPESLFAKPNKVIQ
jgi:hypothetical protein